MSGAIVQLGRLEAVSLREAWPDEARNFTPWLADDANLSLLSDALGLHLELEAVEKPVGPFSADILAKEAGTDRWVLIENQVEPTDHKHLGQLLTYAAGLDARTIIWIAQAFREEHRAAVDFLNRATNEDFSFFGVQVELFRIGESALAPSFTIVAKPNNWSKKAQAGKQVTEEALTPVQALHRDFWAGVIAQASTVYPDLAGRTPYKGNWQTAERLLSSKKLVVEANGTFTQGRLRAEVYLGGPLAKAAYHKLFGARQAIEQDFGSTLSWEELPGKQDSRIACYMPGEQKRENRAIWPAQAKWLIHTLKRLSDTFRPRLQALDLSQLEADEFDSLLG